MNPLLYYGEQVLSLLFSVLEVRFGTPKFNPFLLIVLFHLFYGFLYGEEFTPSFIHAFFSLEIFVLKIMKEDWFFSFIVCSKVSSLLSFLSNIGLKFSSYVPHLNEFPCMSWVFELPTLYSLIKGLSPLVKCCLCNPTPSQSQFLETSLF
jgi:hypothetical protein